MSHRRLCVGLVLTACILIPAIGSAQKPWKVTINPSMVSLRVGYCAPVYLTVLDTATNRPPRNRLGAAVTIADFDMTVAAGGLVVGLYSGASAWSACACPASAGAVATITATYPAQSLAPKARVRGVAFQSSTTVPVVAWNSSAVPIGCETYKTTTVDAGSGVPWTITLTSNASPLPIGTCSPIWIYLKDATGKEDPRNLAGKRVTLADFDMTVTGRGAAGQYYGPSLWSACGCQGAKVGELATITATYPASALAEPARVPKVAFQSSITIPLAKAKNTFNPPECLPKAAVAAKPVPATGTPAKQPLVAVVPPLAKTPAPPTPPPPPTPTGQAPRNIAVTGNPVEALVRWSPPVGPPNPTGYVVERWKAADPQCCRVTSPTLTAYRNQWADIMMWPGPWYYQVTAIYADGLRGSAIGQYNYPEPQTPKNFKAQQIEKDKVLLTWDEVQGAAWYAVGGPPGNTPVRVNGTSHTRTGVPLGKNTWQVATMYLAPERGQIAPDGGPQASSPIVTATLDVVNPRYRLVAEAITVASETVDKQFSEDGIGDEVYVASYSEKFARKSGAPGSQPASIEVQGMRLSGVHGDYSTRGEWRIQAGTGSGYGGIRSGDLVTPILTPQTMTSGPRPMVLWEGDLLPGKHDLVLHPTIWEADQVWSEMAQEMDAKKCGFVCKWRDYMINSSGWRSVFLPGPQAAFDGTQIAVVEGDEVWLGHRDGMVNLELHNKDRPIGLENSSKAPNVDGLTGRMRDKIVVLSSEKIEAALAAGKNKINVRFWDHWTIPNTPRSTINYLNGDYTLVIRIERVP